MTYRGNECTNCHITINGTPEFEYLLDNVHSMLLCKQCAIPVNAFFGNIEKKGIKCASLFEAMTISQQFSYCFVCNQPATKNYYRKQSGKYLLICTKCNSILETYLKAILEQGGKLRDFSVHTNRMNKTMTKILRSSGLNV